MIRGISMDIKSLKIMNTKAITLLSFFCLLSVSNAQNQPPAQNNNVILLEYSIFQMLAENANYVVGIGTSQAHLTERLMVPPGNYTFLCTGFMVSDPTLKSLNMSLLVTATSCNGELEDNSSSGEPYYILGGPMLFDSDFSIKRHAHFSSFRVGYDGFTRDATNDLMYLILPNTITTPDNAEVDNSEMNQVNWRLPSTSVDISNELELGEKVVLIGYNNLSGPNSYECIYLGNSVIYAEPHSRPHKYTIGGKIFCDGLVGTDTRLHGLGGSPIFKHDLSGVLGFMTTYSLEDAFYELSTGAMISTEATNGLVNFVPLIGSKIITDGNKFTKLETVQYEDGVFETTTLNPKTGYFENLSIPIKDNYVHGEIFFRDVDGRIIEYEIYHQGKLVDWNDLDPAMYDIFENQNIYLVQSVVDETAKLVLLNKPSEDVIVPLTHLDDNVEKHDIIRVFFDDKGDMDWESSIIDKELKKFWFN